jgi:hypothetical protein
MRNAWLLLALPLICAAEEKPQASSGWKQVAYPGFVESIDALAGTSAVDCGWLNLMKTRPRGKTESAANACVQEALKSTTSFKFGVLRILADSQAYEVAVRTADGKLWLISYEVMLDGDAPQQSNQVCRGITLDEHTFIIDGLECTEHSRGKLRPR